jgi:hypothetical protein
MSKSEPHGQPFNVKFNRGMATDDWHQRRRFE